MLSFTYQIGIIMKQFLFILFIVVFAVQNSSAQLFEPPLTIENYFPDSGEPERSNNSSAYSAENLVINGSISNIFVWTWDHFRQPYPPGIIGSGLAVRQDTVGGFEQSANPTGFPQDDASSIEAAFVKRSDSVFVLTTYYRPSLQKFFLDIYYFQSGSNLIQMPGFPLDITTSPFGVAHLGWIHLDVHNLDEFVIVWEEDGTLYTKAGRASTLTLGNTAIIDNSLIGISTAIQPDVALIRSVQFGDQTNAHFVYTDLGKNKLLVSSLSFTDILTAPMLGSLYPNLEDMQSAGAGTFERPRIDAPDKFTYDDWSYVVLKQDFTNQQQIIFTGVRNNGIVNHYQLNDGSLSGLADISSTNPASLHYNEHPVVAYDLNGDHIYYCWNYNSTYDMPSIYSTDYIGLKMRNDGNVVPVVGGGFRYWVVSETLNNASPVFSIALSTKNQNIEGLFMAYVRYDALDGLLYGL